MRKVTNVKTLPLKVALAALLLPPAAFVLADEDLSYTYIQGSYLVQDVDIYEDADNLNEFIDQTDDGDGYGLEVSLAFSKNVFGFAGYSDTEADFTFLGNNGNTIPSNTNIKTLQLGLGFHAPMARHLDFVGTASYIDMDLGEFSLGAQDNDVIGGDDSLSDAYDDLNEDSSDGFVLAAGVRSQVALWLELGGGLRYTDVDAGDDISAYGNALFEITQNMGINLAVNAGDNLTTYGLGFRYSM